MDKSAKAKKANAGQSVLSVCMGRVPVLSTVDSKPRKSERNDLFCLTLLTLLVLNYGNPLGGPLSGVLSSLVCRIGLQHH